MLLLPYENMLLRTKISIEEQRSRLENVIGKHSFPDRGFQYIGTFENDVFKVYRNIFHKVIFYRNSFRPVIIGKLMDNGYKRTYIHLTMRPHYFSVVFILLWFGIAIWGLIGSFLNLTSSISILSFDFYSVFPPLFMIFAFYTLVIFSFKLEANKAKRDFIELFEPYQVDELNISNQ